MKLIEHPSSVPVEERTLEQHVMLRLLEGLEPTALDCIMELRRAAREGERYRLNFSELMQGHLESLLPVVVGMVRQAAFREAREAIRGEYLEDPHRARLGEEETGDEIYQRAVRDCEDALCRLAGWPEEREGE